MHAVKCMQNVDLVRYKFKNNTDAFLNGLKGDGPKVNVEQRKRSCQERREHSLIKH